MMNIKRKICRYRKIYKYISSDYINMHPSDPIGSLDDCFLEFLSEVYNG